jgi:glutathione-regulated potassium-efflux system ancillary protein KefF
MTTTARILVIYAHPAPHRSRVNRKLADAARMLPEVYVHDLYETYPDFHINPVREQALIAQSELLVFLHPIQWYSVPSLLKEWVDVVLEPEFAYGKDGGALRGKGYWLVVTTGGTADTYRHGGLHGRPFSDFLAAFEQTAALCGMEWITPHVLFGAHQADDDAVDAHVAAFIQGLENHLLSAVAPAAEMSIPVAIQTTRASDDRT